MSSPQSILVSLASSLESTSSLSKPASCLNSCDTPTLNNTFCTDGARFNNASLNPINPMPSSNLWFSNRCLDLLSIANVTSRPLKPSYISVPVPSTSILCLMACSTKVFTSIPSESFILSATLLVVTSVKSIPPTLIATSNLSPESRMDLCISLMPLSPWPSISSPALSAYLPNTS